MEIGPQQIHTSCAREAFAPLASISVVIPTCERPDALAACLNLFRDSFAALESYSPRTSIQIIVTDDSKSEQTKTLVANAYPEVIYLRGPQRGAAANRNYAALHALGKWLVFCDDDCLPDAKLLGAYLQAQREQPECRVFEGRTIADRKRQHPLEESPINDRGGNLWSCNFAIERDLFKQMGGFDERFPFAAVEDMELRVRLKKAGLRTQFISDAVVVHPWRRLTLTAYLQQHARHRESHLIMMSLHPDYRSYFTGFNVLKDVVRYYAKTFVGDLKAFGVAAVQFQPLYLWAQFRRAIAYEIARKFGKSTDDSQRTDNPD